MYLCPQLGFQIPKVYHEVNYQSPDPEKPHIPTFPVEIVPQYSVKVERERLRATSAHRVILTYYPKGKAKRPNIYREHK